MAKMTYEAVSMVSLSGRPEVPDGVTVPTG